MAIALVNCSTRCTQVLSSMMRAQVHRNSYKFSSSIRPPLVLHQHVNNLHTDRIFFSDAVKQPSSHNLPATDQSDILNTKIAQFRKKIGLYALTRNTLRLSAAHLYVACTDKVPVEIFFRELNLPDTFFSWFVITEIHVWMMMCRLMAEGPEGKFGRNELVKCLWDDCDKRITIYKLPRKQQKEMMTSLSDQFRAAVISYDEGYTTGDKQLAGSLWRTMYSYECDDDPRPAERMIQYIRTQMDHLHTLDKKIFLVNGDSFEWALFEPYHTA